MWNSDLIYCQFYTYFLKITVTNIYIKYMLNIYVSHCNFIILYIYIYNYISIKNSPLYWLRIWYTKVIDHSAYDNILNCLNLRSLKERRHYSYVTYFSSIRFLFVLDLINFQVNPHSTRSKDLLYTPRRI